MAITPSTSPWAVSTEEVAKDTRTSPVRVRSRSSKLGTASPRSAAASTGASRSCSSSGTSESRSCPSTSSLLKPVSRLMRLVEDDHLLVPVGHQDERVGLLQQLLQVLAHERQLVDELRVPHRHRHLVGQLHQHALVVQHVRLRAQPWPGTPR